MNARARLETARILWRTFGTRGVAHRVSFIVRSALGRMRASPAPVSDAVRGAPIPDRWPFTVDARSVRRHTRPDRARERVARVLGGEHHAYRWTWMQRPATPHDWNVNPLTGHLYDPLAPWFRIHHYRPGAGDIKAVWEASRFAWAYDLIRGWMLDRDERYAETFWSELESFLDGCPPYRGVQWACGQETAIRAIAWCWAETAFADAAATTPRRLARLREALAWCAERIENGHDWAASQRNNHGISEAVGLIVLGARLRDADRRAARWIRRGHRLLERYIDDQLATDGWFIQHSFTYARLALDHIVLAERTLRSLGKGLSESSLARIRATIALLVDVISADDGTVPLHGANDGAFVLPFTTADYRDFRPSLSAAVATFDVALPADIGPDGEMLAWLGAEVRQEAPRPVPRLRAGSSGWVHAVTGGARLFTRAAEYDSRPGHIDPLHVDVWIDGQPVATDAGTYRYGAPPPWNNGLSGIEVHNTLHIEGRPPARRGPRFLWLAWPRSRVVEARMLPHGRMCIVMENLSWTELGVVHRRTCTVDGAGVLVVDEVTAPPSTPLQAVVQWLLDGSEDLAEIGQSPELEIDTVRGDESGVRGWVSEGYASKRPATSLVARATVREGRLRIVSAFGTARDGAEWNALLHDDQWTAASST